MGTWTALIALAVVAVCVLVLWPIVVRIRNGRLAQFIAMIVFAVVDSAIIDHVALGLASMSTRTLILIALGFQLAAMWTYSEEWLRASNKREGLVTVRESSIHQQSHPH